MMDRGRPRDVDEAARRFAETLADSYRLVYGQAAEPAEEIEDAMRLAEVMVIPIMPSGLALDTLLQTRRDLRRLGREDRYRVLLTAVPPWPYRRGPQARAQLEELRIPLFGTDIRRLEAFEAAADEGILVRDLADRRAQRGWETTRASARRSSERPAQAQPSQEPQGAAQRPR